jgi:hypothetical protein
MTLRIQRNENGSFKTNIAAHTADMSCDVCGYMRSAIDMNIAATYGKDIHDRIININLSCVHLGGICQSSTSWPLEGGTADAVELAKVKTA